jgi:hypothetical protein
MGKSAASGGSNGTTGDVCNAILPQYADTIDVGSNNGGNHAPAIYGGNIDGWVADFLDIGMRRVFGGDQQQQRGENGGTDSGAGVWLVAATTRTLPFLSCADKEDAPPPLTPDLALHMRLNKADIDLMTAALTANACTSWLHNSTVLGWVALGEAAEMTEKLANNSADWL